MQKRAIEWAHAKGIVAHLHSCGNINAFVPELVEIGLDGLNPLEVKAGMDPVHLKKTYGDKLLLHGGLNAMLWDHTDQIEAEIRRLLPILKRSGGYIFQEDHSIPDNVSLGDFQRILKLAKDCLAGTITPVTSLRCPSCKGSHCCRAIRSRSSPIPHRDSDTISPRFRGGEQRP